MAREARVLSLRASLRLTGLEEAELWANAWLMAIETPPDALEDLAFAKDPAKQWKALAVLGETDDKVDPAEILRIVAGIDASDWSFERLHTLMIDLSEWADALMGISHQPGWDVVNKAYEFNWHPSHAPAQTDHERLRVEMLKVLNGARQFVSADVQAESPA